MWSYLIVMHSNQRNGSKVSALYELDIAFIAFFLFLQVDLSCARASPTNCTFKVILIP